MATPSPNWDLAKSKLPASQAIPNGDIQVDVRLRTTLPDNPRGYLPLVPDAKTREEGSELQYAVQSNGKVTFRVVKDGYVRRQFNNIQEMADSGYNFGFPIDADNINDIIKSNLNDRLVTGTQEKIIGAISTAGSSAAGGGGSGSGAGGDNPSPNPVESKPVTLTSKRRFEGNDIDKSVEKKGILRYPLAIIDGIQKGASGKEGLGQDYLQIGIVEYKPVGSSTFIRNRTTNSLSNSRSAAAKYNTTIILPIPSTIQDGNSVSYADGSLDGITAAAAQAMTNAIEAGVDLNDVTGSLKNILQKIAGPFKENLGPLQNEWIRGLAARAASLPGIGNISREQLLARESGGILNPNMELFFNGVSLRSFKFSFKLTPRNKDEGDMIKSIIRELKVNMAPKITQNDSYLSTPNVFELTYKQGSGDHPFLHKFKVCALTDMSVNYTGDGVYATYGDATPISMIMDLTFKELEPIYDTDYDSVGGVGY